MSQRLSEVHDSAASSERRVGELRGELTGTQARLSDVTRQLTAARERLAAMSSAGDDLRAQLTTTREQLSAERVRTERAEQRAEQLGNDCADAAMRLQLDAKHETIAARLKARVDELSRDAADARRAADVAEQRLVQMDARHATDKRALELRVETLVESTRSLEAQLADLTRTAAATSDSALGVDGGEVAQLRARVAQLERVHTPDTGAAQLERALARAVELEAMCGAERTRRVRVQAKLKEVLARHSSTTPAGIENVVNN
jgi:predicted  nucleic acid-binding Zn-ribbon protein